MMMVVELRKRKDRRKKGGETDAKLTISNISYQKAKKSSSMMEYLKFVTASAFFFIGHRTCIHTWFLCILSERTAILFDIMTLFKINLLVKNSILKIMSYKHTYTRYLFTSVFYQGRSEQGKEVRISNFALFSY